MHTSETRQYAVIGSSGAQGGAIARELLDRGFPVRGVTRSGTGSPVGATLAAADLADGPQVAAALSGVTHLSVTIPLCYDPAMTELYARNIADATRRHGVRKVVLNLNTRIPDEMTSVAGFETRRVVQQVLSDSGVPLVVVRPAVYLENLLSPWVAAGLVADGVLRYPVPAETSIGWMSQADLARGVVAAFEDDGLVGQTLDIGGPDLTGTALAGDLQLALSRPICFEPLSPDLFEAGLAAVIGAEAARGVAGLYHWIGSDSETQVMNGGSDGMKALGLSPNTASAWAAEQIWGPG